MNETIIERLERSYKEAPDTTVSVYPGDVVDIISELRAELAAANERRRRVRQALQHMKEYYESNDMTYGRRDGVETPNAEYEIICAALAAPEQTK